MAKSEGIYSPVLRTRTVGTYKSPSAGQHKAMVKAEGIKYKGLTRGQIVAKAMKSGDIKKLKSMGLKVGHDTPLEAATAGAVIGGAALSPFVAAEYSSKKEKRKKQKKQRTESRKKQRGMSSGGSIKLAKKYFRGGLV